MSTRNAQNWKIEITKKYNWNKLEHEIPGGEALTCFAHIVSDYFVLPEQTSTEPSRKFTCAKSTWLTQNCWLEALICIAHIVSACVVLSQQLANEPNHKFTYAKTTQLIRSLETLMCFAHTVSDGFVSFEKITKLAIFWSLELQVQHNWTTFDD